MYVFYLQNITVAIFDFKGIVSLCKRKYCLRNNKESTFLKEEIKHFAILKFGRTCTRIFNDNRAANKPLRKILNEKSELS